MGWGETGSCKTSDAVWLSLSAQRSLSGHPLSFSRPTGIEKELNKYTNVLRRINVNNEADQVHMHV